MAIETEGELYRQAALRKGDFITEGLVEDCREKYPIITVSLNDGDLKVLRVNSFGMVIPYLKRIVEVINNNLSQEYPRFTIEQLIEQFHELPDGRTLDFEETWRGNTFMIEERGDLVGVAIGRREVVVGKDNVHEFTGRGFVPVVAASGQIRGTFKVALLALLPMKSLAESGVKEIRLSCAQSNVFAGKLVSRLAFERWQDGNWIRYRMNPTIGDNFFTFVVQRLGLEENDIQKLILPIDIGKQT